METENDLRPFREWKQIDLVVRDKEDDSPVLAIEMKVDSHEGMVGGEPQTIDYPKRLPEGTRFLFVTLGVGEFYHAPQGKLVEWIRLRDFHEALRSISTDDCFIEAWKEVIGDEVDHWDRCFSAEPSRIEEYRGQTRNLYFLGQLKEKLIESLSGRDIGIDPFVYTRGRGPDTILYFGRCKLPAYLEINQNGRLNLKVYLGDLEEEEQPKRERAQKAQDYYLQLLGDHNPKLNRRKLKSNAKSKTIMSFDVGIECQNETLFLGAAESDIVEGISKVLEMVYGARPFDDDDIDPTVHPPCF